MHETEEAEMATYVRLDILHIIIKFCDVYCVAKRAKNLLILLTEIRHLFYGRETIFGFKKYL